MEFSVRPYQDADRPRVIAVSSRLIEGFAPWRSSQKVEATIKRWLLVAIDRVNDDDRCIFVIEAEGKVVGFGSAVVQNHYIDGRDASIGELAIDADYEGRQAGQMLLGALRDWALEHDCHQITLQTGAANSRARDFYERFGFQYEDVTMTLVL